MIELQRYARVKPQGLVSAEPYVPAAGQFPPPPSVVVQFKRFDVENGKEVEPETCIVSFEDLEKRLVELKAETEVVQELLALKPE